ncbi:unnamed protein product [Cyprideis torosa]|uniref:Uncharacterized protein n=1 Tax=Cyprideis torosa TaxID=163714 RepID=A0A7R8ZNK3_9CRUS|nr:unnamed protein product [Cyprideis torosa]CAG0887978.1 unnamed protein product [Cyprideis torosa]
MLTNGEAADVMTGGRDVQHGGGELGTACASPSKGYDVDLNQVKLKNKLASHDEHISSSTISASDKTLDAAMALVSLHDGVPPPPPPACSSTTFTRHSPPHRAPLLPTPPPRNSKPGLKRLEAWINRTLKVLLTDGRFLVGEFLCTDRDANIILGHCREYYYKDPDEGGDLVGPRILGLAMVPGKHIVELHVSSQEGLCRRRGLGSSLRADDLQLNLQQFEESGDEEIVYADPNQTQDSGIPHDASPKTFASEASDPQTCESFSDDPPISEAEVKS